MTDELEENQAFARALFGGAQPPAAEGPTDAPPDFDGGPRDTAPGPDNPEHDHNQLIAELFKPQELE
jgi:hypothetical protein